MHHHRFAGRLAALAVLLAASAANAHEYKLGDLTIVHPWTRATPGGATVAGGYMKLVNAGKTADRLLGGSMVAADTFELHEMSMEDGVMKMRPLGPLEIPPGATVTLEPSAKHIMFTGLKRGLKQGEAIDGTLVFEHAGTVKVHFAVEALGAKAPGEKAGHSMPGMMD